MDTQKSVMVYLRTSILFYYQMCLVASEIETYGETYIWPLNNSTYGWEVHQNIAQDNHQPGFQFSDVHPQFSNVKALLLNGSGYVDLAVGPAFFNDDFTLSIHFKCMSFTSSTLFHYKSTSSSGKITEFKTSLLSGTLTLSKTAFGSVEMKSFSAGISLNTWYTLLFCVSQSNGKFESYLDGISLFHEGGYHSDQTLTTPGSIRVGADMDGGSHFLGSVICMGLFDDDLDYEDYSAIRAFCGSSTWNYPPSGLPVTTPSMVSTTTTIPTTPTISTQTTTTPTTSTQTTTTPITSTQTTTTLTTSSQTTTTPITSTQTTTTPTPSTQTTTTPTTSTQITTTPTTSTQITTTLATSTQTTTTPTTSSQHTTTTLTTSTQTTTTLTTSTQTNTTPTTSTQTTTTPTTSTQTTTSPTSSTTIFPTTISTADISATLSPTSASTTITSVTTAITQPTTVETCTNVDVERVAVNKKPNLTVETPLVYSDSGNIVRCASKCGQTSTCVSFSFNIPNKACSLYMTLHKIVDLMATPNEIYYKLK